MHEVEFETAKRGGGVRLAGGWVGTARLLAQCCGFLHGGFSHIRTALQPKFRRYPVCTHGALVLPRLASEAKGGAPNACEVQRRAKSKAKEEPQARASCTTVYGEDALEEDGACGEG